VVEKDLLDCRQVQHTGVESLARGMLERLLHSFRVAGEAAISWANEVSDREAQQALQCMICCTLEVVSRVAIPSSGMT
jgi:hypothetical protein